jgi:hypothetical protein
MRLVPPVLLCVLSGCPEPPPPCASHADCGEAQFCADETFCLDVFDRTYAVTMVEATVPSTGTTGGPWDPEDGSAPDVVAVFGVPPVLGPDGEVIEPEDASQTSVIDDTLNPVWEESGSITLLSERGFSINVFDYEGDGSATFIGGWIWESDAAVVELVRALGEEQQVSSGGLSITLRVLRRGGGVGPVPRRFDPRTASTVRRIDRGLGRPGYCAAGGL